MSGSMASPCIRVRILTPQRGQQVVSSGVEKAEQFAVASAASDWAWSTPGWAAKSKSLRVHGSGRQAKRSRAASRRASVASISISISSSLSRAAVSDIRSVRAWSRTRFLIRETFESIPDQPGLFWLTEPERDGPRRTQQAVHDLRRHGYAVQTDVVLDPAATASPPRTAQSNGLSEQRSRIAQAAAGRSPQHGVTPTAWLLSARSALPEPDYAPTARFPASGPGRSR